LGYSRQGYYKHIRLEKHRELARKRILNKVRSIRARQSSCGTRKLYRMTRSELRSEGIQIGRDRLFDILREEGLLIRPKKLYVRTTQSKHRFRKYRSLVKDWKPDRPEELFVVDITYVSTREGFSYLFLITDAYSRKIMGWYLSKSLGIDGAKAALKMALRNRRWKDRRTIHHSDRGIQYCATSYVEMLEKASMRVSMTEENHVYENALAERMNGILKYEFGLVETLPSHKDAVRSTRQAVEIYNNERLHLSLDYQTPAQMHAA